MTSDTKKELQPLRFLQGKLVTLDSILGGQIQGVGTTPMMAEKYILTIAFSELPNEAYRELK